MNGKCRYCNRRAYVKGDVVHKLCTGCAHLPDQLNVKCLGCEKDFDSPRYTYNVKHGDDTKTYYTNGFNMYCDECKNDERMEEHKRSAYILDTSKKDEPETGISGRCFRGKGCGYHPILKKNYDPKYRERFSSKRNTSRRDE